MVETLLQSRLDSFRQLIRKIKSYEEAVGLMYWDLRTGAPRKGAGARSEVIGELSTEMFKLSVSHEMGEYLEFLLQPDHFAQLDDTNQRMVTECKKEYDRSIKIPPDKYQAYVVLTSQGETAWEDAKANNDFDSFQPYLEKIVAANIEFIELWGYEGHKYNTLLDMYEPGMTVEKLDEVFGALREQVVPLLAAIQASPRQPERDFLHGQQFPKENQKKFSNYILKELGYDFEAGRLDETVHPFATGLNPGDVRITTRYLIDDATSALFGTIHECGHALYEQNISPELIGTNLCTGTSMGIHESQSRFWENIVGRSRGFWSRYYSELQNTFPGQFAVDAETFYRAINHTEPSLIRIEADELTYNLHIMIRYEIEKGLFSGEIKAAELPLVWNAKYKEYLGIEPQTNSEGVLQDVHWAGGSFGYFPSYALGNMYAAQMTETLRKLLPNFDALIAAGDFAPIKAILTEQIYQYGKQRTPNEIITNMTGEALNPNYLVTYLQKKYKDIYGI
jgi:carboxypeptidase Taq